MIGLMDKKLLKNLITSLRYVFLHFFNLLIDNVFIKTSSSKKCRHQVQVINHKINELAAMRQIVRNGQEDSFYLCNVSDIIEKHSKWIQAMPKIKTFYAVKCNDNKIVLQTLISLGIGFDCASKEEIENILSMDVNPNRIIFANPVKKPSHIRYAASVGVNLMTFDNKEELYKIKTVFPKANLVLRMRYDDFTSIYYFGKKFGVDANYEAEDLLIHAKSLDLKVVGVSFHIGTGSKNYKIFSQAIAEARCVFDMATRIGYKFTLLDVGGGFPGEKDCNIKEIGDSINEAIAQYFPDNSIQIIAEPGRYYVDSAFTLATNINSVKSVTCEDKMGKSIETKMYYVDAGIFNALLSAYFGDEYYPQPLFDNSKNPVYPSIIWGPTCTVIDLISKDKNLPLMRVGDWIIFKKAGAYSLTMGSRFNGFPIPKVHSIISAEDWLLLREKAIIPKYRCVKKKEWLES